MPLIYVDMSETLKLVRDNLPAGVSVGLSLAGNVVYLQYSARIMVRGKRLSLGTFLDRDAVIRAVIEAKTRQTNILTTSTAELQAKTQLSMLAAGKTTDAVVAEVTKPRDILTMERIKQLLEIKGMYDWQVTAESAIDVMDGDVMHTITVEDQRNYNDWVVAGFPSDDSAEDNT